MIDEKRKEVLKKAFSILTPAHLENFRWHLRNETPVLCGAPACDLPFYDSYKGSG